jgi:hypothetical protein
MLQLDFIRTSLATSQCQRILERLRAANGDEVNMAELARAGAGDPNGWCMVHSRIADLRKHGLNIPKARVERQPDGAMHSFYRLLP